MAVDSLNTVKEIILKNIPLNAYAVFLFGSRARGTEQPLSDIDVGILGHQRVSARDMLNIQDEVQNSDVLLKVDVIDFTNVSSGFKNEALKHIQVWNCPKDIRLV